MNKPKQKSKLVKSLEQLQTNSLHRKHVYTDLISLAIKFEKSFINHPEAEHLFHYYVARTTQGEAISHKYFLDRCREVGRQINELDINQEHIAEKKSSRF